MVRRLPNRRLVPVLVALALLTGGTACVAGSSEPSAGAASPTEAAPAADLDCGTLDLIGPTGRPVDLTGTWEGGVFLHHVRQVGDCVSWIGYGRWPGTELGELATLTFLGQLASDFTVSGGFTTIVRPENPVVYYPGPREGSLVFVIGFDPDTGLATTLTRVGAGVTDAQYPTNELRLVGPLPESANPPQQ